jgi:hypothetical protein
MNDTDHNEAEDNQEEKKRDKKAKEDPHTLKQNPNPRANANIPEEDKKEQDSKSGVGTEITDGEDG